MYRTKDVSGGFRISQSEALTLKGTLIYYLAWHNFCQKLHENEKHWTERGPLSLAPLSRSATGCYCIKFYIDYRSNFIANTFGQINYA